MMTNPDEQKNKSGAGSRGALVLALALFAVWAAAFIRRASVAGIDGKTYYCLFDDAMISMRYAWNAAHGLGLVWNPGERVEGITNFLMTVLMIPFTALLSKPLAVLGVQIFGIGLMMALAVATWRLARRVAPAVSPELRERYALFCAVAVLAWYPLAFCALMGLESALVSLFIIWSLVLALPREGADGFHFSPGMAVLLGLAFMTRPDAAAPVAMIMVYRLATLAGHSRREDRRAWAALAGECAIIALMAGGLTLFRWLYYGSPLPNTVRLKLGGFPLSERLPQGLRYLAPFLVPLAPTLILAFASFRIPHFAFRMRLLFFFLVAFFLAYPVWIGGDALPHWRLLVPVFPLLMILALARAAVFAERHAARLSPLNRLTLAFFFMLGAADAPYASLLALYDSPGTVTAAEKNVTTALAIEELTTPNATIAVTWGGIIPYYTGRKAIDLLGKCDRYLASLPPDLSGACGGRHDWLSVFELDALKGSAGILGFTSVPGHNKYDLVYSIVKQRPTYSALFAYCRQDVRGFARENYLALNYKGLDIILSFLRDSPDVHWEKIHGRKP